MDSLIRADGSTFDNDVAELREGLRQLPNEERWSYRDRNADEIAQHDCQRLLVMAGPGTGKSHMFLQRIQYWLKKDPDCLVYVATFVRKLVADLQGAIASSNNLEPAAKKRVQASTLHSLARSILERAHGTPEMKLASHISMMPPPWDQRLWEDVFALTGLEDRDGLTWANYSDHLYSQEALVGDSWAAVQGARLRLLVFFNAVTFSEAIPAAQFALDADPDIVRHSHWIFDEYQDFNASEDSLVRTIIDRAASVLIAGDDQQALYEQLKRSVPGIVIGHYRSGQFVNAMLPYCGRCNYYITVAAADFIERAGPPDAVPKVFLPLQVDPEQEKVKVLLAAAPSAAVDFIEKFIAERKADLEQHIERMKQGEESDPFLLILSPDRQVKYFGDAAGDLRALVEMWSLASLDSPSPDFTMAMTYASASGDALNNLALRKVLWYEGVTRSELDDIIRNAIESDVPLSGVEHSAVRDALAHCDAVAGIVKETDRSPEERARAIAEIVHVDDVDRLASELQSKFFGDNDDDDGALAGDRRLQPVELMTIVGSKGLSAKHVIVLGCDDVNMQYIGPLPFYVALTRARSSLTLVVTLRARGASRPHPFLAVLPEQCCDFGAYLKTTRQVTPFPNRKSFEARIDILERSARNSRRTSRN